MPWDAVRLVRLGFLAPLSSQFKCALVIAIDGFEFLANFLFLSHSHLEYLLHMSYTNL